MQCNEIFYLILIEFLIEFSVLNIYNLWEKKKEIKHKKDR